MYAIVSAFCEMPTVNAPYPSCHAKLRACFSFIQCDDTPFTSCMAFANAMVAGNDNRI
jgi:hypothetical protein